MIVSWFFTFKSQLIIHILKVSWFFSKSANYFGIFWGNSLGILWNMWVLVYFTCLELLLEFFTWWVMTQIMDIRRYLGLRGDRQDRTGQKRSLEARAEAFSRLKRLWIFVNASVYSTWDKYLGIQLCLFPISRRLLSCGGLLCKAMAITNLVLNVPNYRTILCAPVFPWGAYGGH